MDITNFANQIIFPLVLFVIVFSLFHLEPYSISQIPQSNQGTVNDSNYIPELDLFYETVSQDDNLMSQLDFILEQENYLEQLVNLGKALGYEFSRLDLERSIAENTASIAGNYVCLPIGCWQLG